MFLFLFVYLRKIYYICNVIKNSKEEREKELNYLKLAIELADDGGCMPFEDEEYKLMYNFLNI